MEQAVLTDGPLLRKGYHADEILYSPLQRAADTARQTSEITGIPRRAEPPSDRAELGIWEDKPRSSQGFKEAKQCFISLLDRGVHVPVAQRVYNLLDELSGDPRRPMSSSPTTGSCALSCHISGRADNEEFADYKVGNCEISRFDFPSEQ